MDRVAEFGGRRVELTNLDKVLWPEAGFTKGQLVDYYLGSAPLILPHVRGRGLTLARYPDGVRGRGFAQTECRGRPDWMRTHDVTLSDGTLRRYCVIDDAAGLAWVANQNALELHPFLAPALRPGRPAALVFDLDPPARPIGGVVPEVALRLRDELDGLGLESFVKTSGAGGLHVYVPLGGSADFERCKSFARATAERLSAADPDRVAASASPRGRGGRMLIDWTRMSERATIVAAYSLRAMNWPSVSMPLRWDELSGARPEDLFFGPEEVAVRVREHGDPFAEVAEMRQELPRI